MSSLRSRILKNLKEIQFIGCSLNGGEEVIVPGMSKILRSQPNTITVFWSMGNV